VGGEKRVPKDLMCPISHTYVCLYPLRVYTLYPRYRVLARVDEKSKKKSPC